MEIWARTLCYKCEKAYDINLREIKNYNIWTTEHPSDGLIILFVCPECSKSIIEEFGNLDSFLEKTEQKWNLRNTKPQRDEKIPEESIVWVRLSKLLN